MEKSNRKVQFLVAVAVSVATVTMGVASAWPTPVLPKFHNNETDFEMNKDQIAWMLAMISPGFMAGSFITGFTSDRLGRRATLLWSAIPYGVGMIMAASAYTSWLLYLTLFFWNCGTGMISNVLSLYFAEISDKEIRGTLQLITRFAFNFGSLLAMCVGPFVSYETFNYLILVLPVCYFLACWWIPESPYYYLKEGRDDNARIVLKKLRGYKDNKTLDDELRRLQSDVKNEMRYSSSVAELFSGLQYRRAIVIASGLKLAQIMTGAMTIQQYLGLIMKESNINLEMPTVIIIFGVIRFAVSIMPSILVDKVGRRPLLIYSFFGTSICLAINGLFFFLLEIILIDKASMAPYGFITFAGIILSNVISTIGYQSIVNIVPGEIFPMNVKAIAITALSIFGGVLSFIVARGYQLLKDVIGLCGVFWVFSAIAVIGAIFTIVFVPETKGKSLREIQMLLQGDLYVIDETKGLNRVNVLDTEDVEGKEMYVFKSSKRNEE